VGDLELLVRVKNLRALKVVSIIEIAFRSTLHNRYEEGKTIMVWEECVCGEGRARGWGVKIIEYFNVSSNGFGRQCPVVRLHNDILMIGKNIYDRW